MAIESRGAASSPEEVVPPGPSAPSVPLVHTRPTVREARRLWPVLAPMAMMLASDYKLRTRGVDSAISGRADIFVLFEVAVYAGVALFLAWRFRFVPRVQRTSTLMFSSWAFVAVLALSAVYSPYPALGLVRAGQLLLTCAVAATLARYAARVDFHRFAHAFMVTVALSVLIGVVHPFPRRTFTADRFNWLYVHQVVCGVYLAIAVLLALRYFLRHAEPRPGPRWGPVAYGALLATFIAALIATGTRGAIVGCLLGATVMAAATAGPRRRPDLLLVGIPVLILVIVLLGPAIVDFAARGEPIERLSTLNSRTDLWALALGAVALQPLFGYGLGASRGLFLEQINLGGGHNAFINVLVDAGIVGALAFCLLLGVLARRLLHLLRERAGESDAPMLLGIFTMLVADSITVEFLAAPANVASVWLFVLVGWASVLSRGSTIAGGRDTSSG